MRSPTRYPEIVQELESRGILPDRPPSLIAVQEGLRRLENLHIDPKKVIVVAGTNGKGSVCVFLETLLIHAGQRVGLYISPHLEETTERIRLNGKEVSKELFCEAYSAIYPRTIDLKLSHFEMLTLMAAWVFFSKSNLTLDWAIFEVGLGGTWDATNAIPHQYCVITSLGMDHENLLGDSIQEIAANKFGIIHNNSTVIHAPLPQEVQPLIETRRNLTQSRWLESIPFQVKIQPQDARNDPLFILQTRWGQTPLSLPGYRGCQNAATALTLFQELGFQPEASLLALNQTRWPGRMERVDYKKIPVPVYYSGDHNPQGVQSLLELLKHYPKNHLHVLVGVGKDKDLDGILSPLFDLNPASIYLTETPFRGRPLESYGSWLKRASGAWNDPLEALDQITHSVQPGDLFLVTGSLYLVGFLKRQLRE